MRQPRFEEEKLINSLQAGLLDRRDRVQEGDQWNR